MGYPSTWVAFGGENKQGGGLRCAEDTEFDMFDGCIYKEWRGYYGLV